MSESYASLFSSVKASHISFSLQTVLLSCEKGTVPCSAQEGVILMVLPILMSSGIFQLVIKLFCVGLPKKSAINWFLFFKWS